MNYASGAPPASGVATIKDAVAGVIGTAPNSTCAITIFRSDHFPLTKTIHADGTTARPMIGLLFDFAETAVAGLDDIRGRLDMLQLHVNAAVLRGSPIGGPKLFDARRLKYPKDGTPATLRDVPRRWLAIDVDGLPLPEGVKPKDLVACGRAAIETLPPAFRTARAIIQATGGHGFKPGMRLRLWFWLNRPLSGHEVRVWMLGSPVDSSVFDPIEPIFTAPPIFDDGRRDPIPCRIAELPGAETVMAPTWGEMAALLATSGTASDGPAPARVDLAAPSLDALVRLLDSMANPTTADRDSHIKVAAAVAGARAGLIARDGPFDMVDEERITSAWVGWVGRWQPIDGRAVDAPDAVAAKWRDDLCRARDDQRSGWRNLMAHAAAVGTDPKVLTDIAGEHAQDQFAVEKQPPLANDMVSRTENAVATKWFVLHQNAGSHHEAGWHYQPDSTPPLFLCGPFVVLGRPEGMKGDGGGLIIRFFSAEGERRDFLVPARVIHASGGHALASYLGEALLPCDHTRDSHSRLAEMFAVLTRGNFPVIRTVDRAGWHGPADAPTFLLPDGTMVRAASAGADKRSFVLRQGDALLSCADDATARRGTLEDWQREIAAYAVGNHRMALFLSTSFLPPLLKYIDQPSGGFHIVWDSSTGKSTLLFVAASVWGPGTAVDGYVKQWRATTNGLEGLAAASSDQLLTLDEMHQAPAKETAQAVYMLFNEAGKSSMTRNRQLRPAATWRISVLSTGERTVAQLLATAGEKSPPAGLAVRLVEISGDAGAGHGVFDVLHGMADGAALSKHLQHAAKATCGTAGRAFLAKLVDILSDPEKRAGLVDRLRADHTAFVKAYMPMQHGDMAQVGRVADRFGAAAAAGELATRLGILPWPAGTATAASGACFGAWLAARGGTAPQEHTDVIRRARLFLETHGGSRFTELRPVTTEPTDTGFTADLGPAPPEVIDNLGPQGDYRESQTRTTLNRAGWRMATEDGTDFAILRETFRTEICMGGDPAKAAKVLFDAGFLRQGDGNNWPKKVRVPELGQTPIRCYVISGAIIAGD